MARRTILLLVTPLLLWSGYWVAAAYALEQGVQIAAREARKSGIVAGFQDISVTGYPKQFDMGVSDVSVSVQNAFKWETHNAVVHAASWKPNHINVDLSSSHRINWSFGATSIDTKRADISVLFQPLWLIPLAKISVQAQDMAIVHVDGLHIGLGAILAHMTGHAELKDTYNLTAELKAIDLTKVLHELPLEYQSMQRLRVNADMLFNGSWDRTIFDYGAPILLKTVINYTTFDFGKANVSLSGHLTYKESLGPSGQINLNVQGWQTLFELAKSIGFVAPNLEVMFLTLLTDLAAQDGDTNTITLPLSVQNGRVSYGALNLAALPKIP